MELSYRKDERITWYGNWVIEVAVLPSTTLSVGAAKGTIVKLEKTSLKFLTISRSNKCCKKDDPIHIVFLLNFVIKNK